MFFSPFSIAITSLGEERANLSAFRTFVRFVLVWFCLFSFPLGVWKGLRFVIVAPLDFSLTFFTVHQIFDRIVGKRPSLSIKIYQRIEYNRIYPDCQSLPDLNA